MPTAKKTTAIASKRLSKIKAELDKLDKLGTELSTDGKKPVDELDWEMIKIGNEILRSSAELRKLVKLVTKSKESKHG